MFLNIIKTTKLKSVACYFFSSSYDSDTPEQLLNETLRGLFEYVTKETALSKLRNKDRSGVKIWIAL